MATATTSKSDFVRDFLGSNPQAIAKSVNEAWTAAGMKGTISHPTISEVRKELGLIAGPARTLGNPGNLFHLRPGVSLCIQVSVSQLPLR